MKPRVQFAPHRPLLSTSAIRRKFFVKYPPAFAFAVAFMFAWRCHAQAETAQASAPTAKPFAVFDNMFYAGKPDLSRTGLIRSSVIYNRLEWKTAIAAGQFPDEAAFKEDVKKHAAEGPGPVVIDIEYVFLSQTRGTTDAEVKNHFKLFVTLAKWAREAAPGHLVGYYGHGLFPEEPGKEYAAETKELIAAVDAFFPSMYVHSNQTAGQWKEKLQSLIAKAHEIAPGKPVFPYLWPQYHEATPESPKFVNGDYMKFQLETARDCGADGVVIWSSSKFAWKDAPWFEALLKFVADKPVCNNNVKFNQPKTGNFEPE
jgi:hypothetical protein